MDRKLEEQVKTYVLKVEPFTKFDEPKDQALKPLEEAAEVFGAWQASGIDGAGSITQEMREDIVYECFDTIQACVNLLESIGTTDAELRDSARKVYANNVERGRYEPY
jgi:hypothetical protein